MEAELESLFNNSAFIFWGSITLICIVPVIAHYWWKSKRDELDASLKQTMLDRGMSADEIQKVLEASSKDESTTVNQSWHQQVQ